MSNVITVCFATRRVINTKQKLYTVVDPGITWYEPGQIVTLQQLKADADTIQEKYIDWRREMQLKKRTV